jgi:hypothetical protein
MKRDDYAKTLRAAAKALQQKRVAGEPDSDESHAVDAVAITGSYAEAARIIPGASPGGVRGDFQRVAKRHGITLPKMPHTSKQQRQHEAHPYVYACCKVFAAAMRKVFAKAEKKGCAKYRRELKRAQKKGGK